MKSTASTSRKKATVKRKRYIVKKPATLKDYIRTLGISPSVCKEAEKLEKALCPARRSTAMKASATKRASPVIVPIRSKEIQKEYAMPPAEAKRAISKISGLYTERKAAGKVTRLKGRFSQGFFD